MNQVWICCIELPEEFLPSLLGQTRAQSLLSLISPHWSNSFSYVCDSQTPEFDESLMSSYRLVCFLYFMASSAEWDTNDSFRHSLTTIVKLHAIDSVENFHQTDKNLHPQEGSENACSYNLAGIFQSRINYLYAVVQERLILLLLRFDSCCKSLGDIKTEHQQGLLIAFILISIKGSLSQFKIDSLMLPMCCIISFRDHSLALKPS